jgi:hypothetical protein
LEFAPSLKAARHPYFSRPSPGKSSPLDMTMPIAAPELDLFSIEKLREEELDEARGIQSGMLPTQPLRNGGITISREFQPATLVGGDYLDYFSLPDGMIGRYVGDVSDKGLPTAMLWGAGGRNAEGHPQNGTASGPGDGPLEQEAAAPRHTRPTHRHPIRPARSHHGAIASFQRRNAKGLRCCGQENAEF